MEEAKENYASSYSKKWLTPQYIIGYLVFAVLVYGAIYYFFLRGSGGYNSGSQPYSAPVPDSQNQPSATSVPSATDEQTLMQNAWKVSLSPLNTSGQSGTAYIYEINGKTKVVLQITGETATASEPDHIHLGACPTPGAVKYSLNNVVSGKSETLLDVTVAQLKAQLPLAINVHKSDSEIKTYVSCGDLK